LTLSSILRNCSNCKKRVVLYQLMKTYLREVDAYK
jgi:hypothetical protein